MMRDRSTAEEESPMSRYRRSAGPSVFDLIMFLLPLVVGAVLLALFIASHISAR